MFRSYQSVAETETETETGGRIPRAVH